MACLRLTLVEPSSGSGDEAQHVLEALDGRLAHTPGLILSFITEMENDRLARVALWQTKEDANRVAMREDILALRSRLRRLTVRTEETLLDVKSGSLPPPVTQLLSLPHSQGPGRETEALAREVER